METSKWTKQMLSASLIASSGFLIFYSYSKWIGYYHFLWMKYDFSMFLRLTLFASLDRLFTLYLVVAFASFTLALFIAFKLVNFQISKLAMGILLASLTVVSNYLIFMSYELLIRYISLFHEGPDPLPHFAAGFVSLIFSFAIIDKALKAGLGKLASIILSSFLMITDSLLVFYVYNVFAEYNYVVSLHAHAAFLGQYEGALQLGCDIAPFYIAFAFTSFILGLIVTYRLVDVLTSKLAVGTLLAILTGLSAYLISATYPLLLWYSEVKISGFELPLYLIGGFASLGLSLLMTYKALKAQLGKLANTFLSSFLIVTGLLLTVDAYRIWVQYHDFKFFIENIPSLSLAQFDLLKQAIRWLPLYITIASILLAYGLMIAYKTLKSPKPLLN